MKEIKTADQQNDLSNNQRENDYPLRMESVMSKKFTSQFNHRDMKYQDENPENVHITSQMEQNYTLKIQRDA